MSTIKKLASNWKKHIKDLMIVLALGIMSHELGRIIGGYGIGWFVWGWGIFIGSVLLVMWLEKKYKGNPILDKIENVVASVMFALIILLAITDLQVFISFVLLGLFCIVAPFIIIGGFLFTRIVVDAGSPDPGKSADQAQFDSDEASGKLGL